MEIAQLSALGVCMSTPVGHFIGGANNVTVILAGFSPITEIMTALNISNSLMVSNGITAIVTLFLAAGWLTISWNKISAAVEREYYTVRDADRAPHDP
jgi:hypothetical protein